MTTEEAILNLKDRVEDLKAALDDAAAAGVSYAAVVVAHRETADGPRLTLMADGADTDNPVFTMQTLGAAVRELWPTLPVDVALALLQGGMAAMDEYQRQAPQKGGDPV